MPLHYVRRQDLSKYTLKSFDSADEIMADTNNGDQLTINKNGTQVVLQDSNSPSASSSPIEILGAASAGAVTSAYTLIKTKTAVADNTATDVFTVTVPNPTVNANATFIIQVLGVIGAGGAVGAGEATSGSLYVMSVARTVGATAVITTGAQLGVAASKVSGGHTFTCTVGASAVTGASSATETFTIQATAIDVSSGATNHVVTLSVIAMNGAVGGVTIA